MTANPLKAANSERVIAPQDKEAKVRFWLDHGNQCLLAHGKPHLHWRHHDGHYWIEEREETFRQITRQRDAA
jgi:hypothetical protein